MSETYCVLYQDARMRRPAKRLSMAYDSLDRAINAAFNIAERQFEPLEIRGSEGTLIKASELSQAITICAA